MFLESADFSLDENEKMARSRAFPKEHFAGGKPPFFRLLDANLLILLEIGKKRNLAEQAYHALALRHLFDRTQNRLRC
jgi:hypothetical protein